MIMNKSSFVIFLSAVIIYIIQSIILPHSSWNVVDYIYAIFFLITLYVFSAITDIKKEDKLKKFVEGGDLAFKYYLALFALFSTYLLLESDLIVKLNINILFGLLWYPLLSIFILVSMLLPSSKFFLMKISQIYPKVWSLFILFIYGMSFSILTALVNVEKLKLPVMLDSTYYYIISFLELIIFFTYSVFFFKINLRLFQEK
jgi:hypothetical protein